MAHYFDPAEYSDFLLPRTCSVHCKNGHFLYSNLNSKTVYILQVGERVFVPTEDFKMLVLTL